MKTNAVQSILGANIIWALVVFILCAMPGEDIPNPRLDIPHLDKIVHFGMFFIMTLLISHYLGIQTNLRQRTIYTIAILVAFTYGGLIEILQHYFFGRSGDLWDLSADLAGGIVACLCYPLFKRLILRQKR